MPADNPRKHHYLPQFYLKGFADSNGRLSQLMRNNLKLFVGAVGDAAAERDFHRLDIQKPDFDPNYLEKQISKIESEQATLLGKIVSSPSLVLDCINDLAAFTLFMLYRVPKAKIFIQQYIDSALRGAIDVMEKKGKFAPVPEEVRALFPNKKTSEIFQPKAKNWFVMQLILQLATDKRHLKTIANMNVSLVMANGFETFIVGDAPVVIYDAAYAQGGLYAGGFASRTFEIMFPLTPRLLLHFSWDGFSGVVQASLKDVFEYNRRAFLWSDKMLFADIFSSPFLREASRLNERRAGYNIDAIDAETGFLNIGSVTPVHPGLY